MSHLDFSVASFWNENLVAIHLHRELLHPGDSWPTPVFILGLHTEEGEAGSLQTLPGQQVGTRALEVEEEAIESVIVWLSKHYACTGLHGAAVEEFAFGIAYFEGTTRSFLAIDLIVEIQTAALDGTVQVFPKHLPSPKELSWGIMTLQPTFTEHLPLCQALG